VAGLCVWIISWEDEDETAPAQSTPPSGEPGEADQAAEQQP
jgi:hypothetical protein